MTWFTDKTLLVPIDFSDYSLKALEQALTMASSPSRIHVIHVLQEPSLGNEIAWAALDLESQVGETTKALYDRFKEEKYRGVKVHVCYGDPGTEIAKYADAIKADLIVISSQGRRGWKRILIGSVAERVLRLAHCPVFVLKSQS